MDPKVRNIIKADEHEDVFYCCRFFKKLILNQLHGEDINCWIAGGAIRDYFSGERKFKDIDIYFPNEDEFNKAFEHFEELERIDKKRPNYDPSNPKVEKIMATSRSTQFKYGDYIFDLVNKIHGEPEDVLDQFDFTVCAASIDREKMVHHKDFFMHLALKKLVLYSGHTPVTTLARIQKYAKKGYTMNGENLVELARLLADVDFDNPEENILEFYKDGEPRAKEVVDKNYELKNES